MKNISISLVPYSSGYPPAPPMPANQSILKPTYSVSASAQFDDELEALAFAAFVINKVNEYKDQINHA